MLRSWPRSPSRAGLLLWMALPLAASRHAVAEEVDKNTHECIGGNVGICRCLLSHPRFKRDPDECNKSKEPDSLASSALVTAMEEPNSQCATMGLLVECSRNLDCYDQEVMERCLEVDSYNDGCDLECKESTTTETMTTVTSTSMTTTVTEVIMVDYSSTVLKFAMLFAACVLPLMPMVVCGCFPKAAAGCVETLRYRRSSSQKFQPLAGNRAAPAPTSAHP
ncbi:unnamed protein product [Prorocentrum cordatum]|uniref:Uncharacterized protein n=1 Tax=Prorocentrum cordatum TaxID=2364126 RepID=A0ABN9YBJ9_9DINO|nr:unnamed protein product [Polarella glacialis]